MPVGHLYACLLWENISSNLLTIFYLACFSFFDVELYKLCIHFGYQFLISLIICKYFIPLNRLSLSLSMVSFAMKKFLSLIGSHLFIFFAFFLCLRRQV